MAWLGDFLDPGAEDAMRRDLEARRYWRSRQKAPFTDPDMDGKEAWGHVLYDLSQGRVDPFYFERTFGRASLLAQSLI